MLPKSWPKWSVVLIAFGLIALTAFVGIIMVPLSRAVAPEVTPAPTLPVIDYARPVSGACEACHMDKQAVAASALSQEDADKSYIEPESLSTPHGALGCITCHGGQPDVQDKEGAHRGLVTDLSETHPETCLLCHRNLPDQIPEDNLRTPHGKITDAVWEGSACGVLCSDCHGQVGHGFDPVTGGNICAMSVCVDCHQERNLDASLNQCDSCHVGPHDVASVLTCDDCHTDTNTWKATQLGVHPVALDGYHAQADCFDCHRWPNFKNLDNVCSDCHQRPHEFGSDDCSLCHTPVGWTASADALVEGATAFPHPAAGREECRSCHGVEGGQSAIPEDHKGRTNDTCLVCHEAAPAPAILHPVIEHEACLTCHGEGEVAQFTPTIHAGRDETTCQTCHEPAGVVPLAILHTLEGRQDCLMCHSDEGVHPSPATHEGWQNELCLLCHEGTGAPTAAEHTFPQDHNMAAGNCALCHPANDFETYHCETCHAPAGMGQVHASLGIASIEDRCVLCHPNGTKP